MDKELAIVLAMSAGGILGALGGMGLSFPSKWLRRFVLPLIWGGIALLSGFLWWKVLCYCVGTIVALCLPYGEKTPYWGKFLTGCAFIAPTAILGWTSWQIITPLAFIALFKFSNMEWTQNVVVWKVAEFITFAFVGLTMVMAL